MQQEHENRGTPPASAEVARERPVGAGTHPAPDAEPRPPLASETVPSEQLWRAAIRAAREAATLAAELRRQLAAGIPPRASS